jgi:hypothetical protein
MQILLPSTMQWITFNGHYVNTPLLLSLWRSLAHVARSWLALLLESGYSSNQAGDGPRSAEAQRRRNKARRAKYIQKIECHRQRDAHSRGEAATLAPVLSHPLPTPGGTRTRPSTSAPNPVPPSAVPFYNAHPGSNRFLEVRIGGNITGSDTERGVFSRCLIPPHTRLAPYLGTVRPASATGPYCLQVRDHENTLICLDAMHHCYDVGYLHPLTNRQREHTPTPRTMADLSTLYGQTKPRSHTMHSSSQIPQKASPGSFLVPN